MIKPRDYQQDNINEILEKFNHNDRVCYSLSTGGGKTVVFSFLSKQWIEKKDGKVLIVVHRQELLDQSCETLNKIGLTYEKILPSTKRLHHSADCYVAMVETLFRRLQKNKDYLKDVSLMIVDECHILVAPKIFDFFPNTKILGVTATPVLLGRDTFWKCERCKQEYDDIATCCGMEAIEWSRPRKMSNIYQDIVVGVGISELIDMGSLVRDINFVRYSGDIDKLKTDSSGEYTNESQEQAFGASDSVFNVVLNYEQLALGKRTIVFNNSTKTNLKVYKEFVSKGYNAKMYDSVNDTGESRKTIVEWFRNTPDAVLLNCGVFTEGLDVKEIECVLINMATTSLAKFLQVVGRGGRPSQKIYKDSFIVIDGGGNIERLGTWSDPTRDWKKIFFEGQGKEKAKSEKPLSVQECKECACLFARSESTCPNCGWRVPIPEPRQREAGDEVLVPIDAIPLPSGDKIAKYAISRGEGKSFAFKVMTEQVIDLFRFNLVSRAQYLSNKNDGRLDKRLGEIIRPVYFSFLNNPDLKEGANRTLKRVIDDVKKKLDKYYNIN